MTEEQANEAPWRQRFRAPRVTLPTWAEDAPDRLVYASNKSGKWEVYTWDRAADTHRQLTDRREGTLDGYISPSGDDVWWFDDTDGDEFGQWVAQPFESQERRLVAESLDRAYSTGLNIGRSLFVIGTSDDDDGTSIYVLRDGQEPRRIYQNSEASWLGGVSGDEQLICFHHAERSDSRHPELRVTDVEGNTVAELSDGPAGRIEQHAGDEARVLHQSPQRSFDPGFGYSGIGHYSPFAAVIMSSLTRPRLASGLTIVTSTTSRAPTTQI